MKKNIDKLLLITFWGFLLIAALVISLISIYISNLEKYDNLIEKEEVIIPNIRLLATSHVNKKNFKLMQLKVRIRRQLQRLFMIKQKIPNRELY